MPVGRKRAIICLWMVFRRLQITVSGYDEKVEVSTNRKYILGMGVDFYED